MWIGDVDGEGGLRWGHIVGPSFCSRVITECVVGKTVIVVIASFEEGGAATIPAAVRGVLA